MEKVVFRYLVSDDLKENEMKEKCLEYTFESVYPLKDSLIKIEHLYKVEPTVGRLAVIDPESLALVVATCSDVRLVIASSVLSLQKIPDDSLHQLFKAQDLESINKNFSIIVKSCEKAVETSGTDLSDSEVKANKERVIEALSKEHLVFKEDPIAEIIVVLNCVQIHRPYLSSSCYSGNELILQRVKKLLRKLET